MAGKHEVGRPVEVPSQARTSAVVVGVAVLIAVVIIGGKFFGWF